MTLGRETIAAITSIVEGPQDTNAENDDDPVLLHQSTDMSLGREEMTGTGTGTTDVA